MSQLGLSNLVCLFQQQTILWRCRGSCVVSSGIFSSKVCPSCTRLLSVYKFHRLHKNSKFKLDSKRKKYMHHSTCRPRTIRIQHVSGGSRLSTRFLAMRSKWHACTQHPYLINKGGILPWILHIFSKYIKACPCHSHAIWGPSTAWEEGYYFDDCW